MPQYEAVVKINDIDEKICDCYICVAARFKGHSKPIKGAGHVKQPAIGLMTNNFKGVFVSDSKRVQNKDNLQTLKTTLKICAKCKAQIGRGKPHPCRRNFKAAARKNIIHLVEDLPEKQRLQVVSYVLRKKACAIVNPSARNISLELNTGGRSKTIQYTHEENNILLTHNLLDKFQNQAGCSNQFMKKITNLFRCVAGKNSVEIDYRKHMTEKSKTLENCYHITKFNFDVAKEKNKKELPVIWTNVEKVLEAVIIERKLIGNYKLKIMGDKGKKFFKISMSILPEELFKEKDDDEPAAKRRKLYSEGGSAAHASPATSVKKLILLCVVPDISETYDNLKTLFELIKMNDVLFKFVCDFKLLLLINGQQTATATFLCPYCFVRLQNLRDLTHENCEENVDENRLKTFGDLRRDYQSFCARKKKEADENFVTAPLTRHCSLMMMKSW